MNNAVLFEPLIDWTLIYALAGVMLASVALALWRGLKGWLLRGFGALVILAAAM